MEYGLGKVEESVELWFSDNQTDHVKVSVKVEKQLFGEQTDFQRIDVFESRELRLRPEILSLLNCNCSAHREHV